MSYYFYVTFHLLSLINVEDNTSLTDLYFWQESIVAQGASARKLEAGDDKQIPSDHHFEGIRFIDVLLLQNLIGLSCVCRGCKLGNLILRENFMRKMGLASLLVLECDTCSKVSEIYSSATCKDSRAFEINRRAVLGFLEIGGGKTALNNFCAMLNMPTPMTNEAYNDSLKSVKKALEAEATESMKKAALEEKSDSAALVTECQVMFDGTWRKRGFSSLQGAVTAISAKTGKCLDYETLNKVCYGCSKWKKMPDSPAKQKWLTGHTCSINYVGSAPAMEPEGVKRIFLRSESDRCLQYTGYIGDGDSKSYSHILKVDPYNGKSIRKYECVGHVQKRLGTALRKLKSQYGRKKLSDNKPIGGYGRLTADRIDKLQTYYGLAIRRHKDDLDGMRKEIWAGLYHSASTDDHPQHQFCPDGPDTWCKFNQSVFKDETYHHSKPLPATVVDIVKPIYERLSSDTVLEGCLGGFTQNNCESLNHLIWARCPKSVISGKTHLDAATAGAVLSFNEGRRSYKGVLKRLGIIPGTNSEVLFGKIDKRRIQDSNKDASVLQKKIRKARRAKRKASEDKMTEKEGITYSPGAF